MNDLFFKRWRWWLAVIVLIILGLYCRPLPQVTATLHLPQPPPAQTVDLAWPAGGQAALAAQGYGLLAGHGSQQPAPIGSTAKVITALAVLKQKPLVAGQPGPALTLTQNDVDLYNSYYSQNGSISAVSAGEQITEYQALESLLLPSSNNMADTLASWAFGSQQNYLKYANQMVKNLGLAHTTVGDTNGFSDTTLSTADDLAKLGLVAIKNPVLAQIVGQTQADVPVAGTIKNTNFLLGDDGIIGIKTGHTDKAGGNYIFAAKQVVQGHQLTLVGAILNQPDLTSAIQASLPLISSADNGFESKTIIHKNQVIGVYKAPWGAKSNLISPKDINLLVWIGSETKITATPETTGPNKAGAQIGKISASNLQQSQTANLVLSNQLSAPSTLWRIYR